MFYPKISGYVLLRNNKVAKIAQENVAGVADIFSVEILPDFRPATFTKGFIVKTLPALVDLDSLLPKDKIRLASGRVETVKRIVLYGGPYPVRVVTENSCLSYHRCGSLWNSTSSNPFNIVEIIPQVNLHTLQPGDTVELASGETKEIKSVAYNSILRSVQVVFTTSKSNLPWSYRRDGAEPNSPMLSIVKIIPKPKLNLYALEPGAVVTLANGNTKEVLKVDLRSRAHTNHVCITLADGVWIYNPDGTRPPGRDSAYNVVGVTKITFKPKPTPLTVNGHTVKSGDRLRLRNGTVSTVKDVTWNEHDDNWTVAYGGEFAGSLRNFSYYSSGKNPFNSRFDITAVVNEPTPLTIGGHIVEPGDVLTRAGRDQIVVDKITPEPCGNWKVWHSAYGGCFFEVDSSGHSSALPSLSITAVVPNRTAPPCCWPANPFWYLTSSQSPRQVPWPKPITTPPTKKDADPIRQVAVLDKEGDWMQEEWWAARDMLDAGEITGWAHTQAWHDAKNKLSDPWN